MVEVGLVYAIRGPAWLDFSNPIHMRWILDGIKLLELVASPVSPPKMMGEPRTLGVRLVILCGHLHLDDGTEAKTMDVPVSWLSEPLRGIPLEDGWTLFVVESRHIGFIVSQKQLDDVQRLAYGSIVWRQTTLRGD